MLARTSDEPRPVTDKCKEKDQEVAMAAEQVRPTDTNESNRCNAETLEHGTVNDLKNSHRKHGKTSS